MASCNAQLYLQMIHFFGDINSKIFAVQKNGSFSQEDTAKLSWLFGHQPKLDRASIDAFFVGPRAAMITPWSTNATEISQNMGIDGIVRIEQYMAVDPNFKDFDPMLSQKYDGLEQNLFTVDITPQPLIEVEDIQAYNQEHGLALSKEEIEYLEDLSKRLDRRLTDSEVFGFSQVNSEHCRHKIFNGSFVIDGKEMPHSLFSLIKQTSKVNPNEIVSAYKDNVAFIKGPRVIQFAPRSADVPDYYEKKPFDSVISLKAETHNFPTTVEPFNGAATGSGGEIRDRMAGGKGAVPLAGTAVYMTAYSRLSPDRPWEDGMKERPWLYQTPMDILIKASNGASDFGNKFGQPLITGSVLTFEHEEDQRRLGYDKVIMMAGGIGYGKASQALKDVPEKGDKIVILGGDNYRIGMGGAAVSSADTGEFSSSIELNAVQRSNPEMQKRAANAIRALIEREHNPIVSIHDHGAGGHLNCLSELVEETGGVINLDKLPVGDPTLSAKEIIGNESQERMGLIIGEGDMDFLNRVAQRERSPLYDVGEVTADKRFTFTSEKKSITPMDLDLSDMFGSSPHTILNDQTINREFNPIEYSIDKIHEYLNSVLQLEAVACKDWLTNKVDRCVGGLVAKQQCAGPLQLPLNNCGVMALDFEGKSGIATSIGHSPVSGLIDPGAASRLSVTESLTNIIWAPLENGLQSISLSANWMWPCKNPGEDARLYRAVEALSEYAIGLGINVPTGKDSLSMKQKYSDGDVLAPGTVIVSAAAQCSDINKVVEPVISKDGGDLYYIHLSGTPYALGGSSFAQILNRIGKDVPDIANTEYVVRVFAAIQELIQKGLIDAGHDVSSGGLITTLLEMCFADPKLGLELKLDTLEETDTVKLLFSENAAIVFQAKNKSLEKILEAHKVSFNKIGRVIEQPELSLQNFGDNFCLNVSELRDIWYYTSYLHDSKQTDGQLAKERFNNYKLQPLRYKFPQNFSGKKPEGNSYRPKAAVIREKGSNSEREMANAMYMAGFDVKDVHMTDLISGRESLEDIQFIGAVGGFSNSDVLGSAKGWAGAFKYNKMAKESLKRFFARPDTLSVGICNGCQLFMELDLIYPDHEDHGKMTYNDSGKHESGFTSVTIRENNSVMLSSMAGVTLGVWISNGEGKFKLPYGEDKYKIVAKYAYEAYPADPNGSDYNTAMLCDVSGRHLVTMPHIERSVFPWNWAHYPRDRSDEISPWIEAFVNARQWVEKHQRQEELSK